MRRRFEGETTRFLAAWMKLRQMVQAANFNRFHQAGLSATQFMTLNVVPKEGMTLTGLARKLNLSVATLSATVNSLEERGLLERARDGGDARRVNLRATADGLELQNSASREFHGYIAEIFERMSKAERDGLLGGLEKMVQRGEETGVGATRRDGGAPPAKRSSRRSAAG